jgi:small subunit ribosomal protein S18
MATMGRPPRRRRVCLFCAEGMEYIDYKNVMVLERFLGARGKITPNRVTGTCTRHQRRLTHAIKRARQMAMLPYVTS